MADFINEGGILSAGLPRLCERGYSLTPVDIAQSDHNPTEEDRACEPEQKLSAAQWHRVVAVLVLWREMPKVHLWKSALPNKYKAHLTNEYI